MKTKPCTHDPLWLASQSPRRRELLGWLALDFSATHADLDETPHADETPAEVVVRLARAKAQAADGIRGRAWILAADTEVALDNAPLGKPQDAVAARAMLKRLRDDHHQVHTGLALYNPASGTLLSRRVTTQVWMRPYSDLAVERYIASGDPFDKAGAYAIQHPDFDPVNRLDRCYANVVGLPLCAVVTLLKQAGCDLVLDLPALCRARFGYDCPARDRGMSV